MAGVLLDKISFNSITAILSSLKLIEEWKYYEKNYNPIKDCSGGFSIKVEDLLSLFHNFEQYEAKILAQNIDSFATVKRDINYLKEKYDTEPNKQCINSLPDDILSDIFLMAKSPLYISRVCQHFRKIAINSPLLWSEIDTSMTAKRVKLFLSRSGSTPLSIFFNGPVEQRGFFEFVRILVPHLDRWSRIDMFAREDGIVEALSPICDLRNKNSGSTTIHIPALSQFNCGWEDCRRTFELLDRGTVAKAGIEISKFICVKELGKCLQGFTNLRYLSLEFDIMETNWIIPSGEPNRTLKNIEDLTIFMHQSPLQGVLIDVVCSMEFPDLTTLTVKISRNSEFYTQLSLPGPFLDRIGSYGNLTRFNFIADRHCKQIDLLQFLTELLKHCRFLHHVYVQARCKLSQIESSAELFIREPWDSSHPLRSLELDNCSGLRSRDARLIGELVRSGCSTFELLKIHRCNLLDQTFLSAFEQSMGGRLEWTIAKVPCLNLYNGWLICDPSDEWTTIKDNAMAVYQCWNPRPKNFAYSRLQYY